MPSWACLMQPLGCHVLCRALGHDRVLPRPFPVPALLIPCYPLCLCPALAWWAWHPGFHPPPAHPPPAFARPEHLAFLWKVPPWQPEQKQMHVLTCIPCMPGMCEHHTYSTCLWHTVLQVINSCPLSHGTCITANHGVTRLQQRDASGRALH